MSPSSIHTPDARPRTTPPPSPRERISHAPADPRDRAKRTLDLSIMLSTSPVWLPLLLILAGWILLVSRGPVFFRQQRVGRDGRSFTMLKLRTMHPGSSDRPHRRHIRHLARTEEAMTKLDELGDPRLIRGGRFLRASGLDELPQLFNIWRGEMSLVGPRPCLRWEYRFFDESHHPRFDVRPGLTGPWQLGGRRRRPFREMAELDVRYARDHSFGTDLRVLAATPRAVADQLGWHARRPLPGAHALADLDNLAEAGTAAVSSLK